MGITGATLLNDIPFTQAQYGSIRELLRGLMQRHPGIKRILFHSEILPAQDYGFKCKNNKGKDKPCGKLDPYQIDPSLARGDVGTCEAPGPPVDMPPDVQVTWSSSDKTKATVSPDGLVTAVGPGTATITAKIGNCGEKCEGTVDVEVTGRVFKVIALTGDTIAGKTLLSVGHPYINDAGEVAFGGNFRGPGIFTPSGIFTQNGAVALTGDTIAGKTLVSVGLPSMNSGGEVAFAGFFGTGSCPPQCSGPDLLGEGIFTQNGAVALTGDTIAGKTLTSGLLFSTSINDAGEVAFHAFFDSGQGIFTQNGAVAVEGDVAPRGAVLLGFGVSSINNTGEVAFEATILFGDRHGLFTGILTQNRAVALPGDTIAGKTLTNFGAPSMNNGGEVAFVGGFAGGPFGIFTQSGAVALPGDTIAGKTLTRVGTRQLSINDGGEVAFVGGFLGGHGIFTQNGAVALTGDTLDGKTLTRVERPSINNGGEVAFVGVYSGGPFGPDELEIGTGIFVGRAR